MWEYIAELSLIGDLVIPVTMREPQEDLKRLANVAPETAN
jgi:hypothetical protein